jgi:hypothetical protein
MRSVVTRRLSRVTRWPGGASPRAIRPSTVGLPPDMDSVRALARAGDLDGLAAAIAAGTDVDDCEPYTGVTALSAACGAGRAEAVELLLASGADPNRADRDGVYPFDATHSAAIRRLLVTHGFSQRLASCTTGRGLLAMRILAAGGPVDETHTLTIDGSDLHLEYRIGEVPAPSGRIRLGDLGVIGDEYGHHRLPGSAAEVNVGLERFTGELRIRVYCAATIAGNDGPREFWLPSLEDA